MLRFTFICLIILGLMGIFDGITTNKLGYDLDALNKNQERTEREVVRIENLISPTLSKDTNPNFLIPPRDYKPSIGTGLIITGRYTINTHDPKPTWKVVDYYDSSSDMFSIYIRHQLPWFPNGGPIAGRILDHIPNDSIIRWLSRKTWDSLKRDYNKDIKQLNY